jgi:hypothetical protein
MTRLPLSFQKSLLRGFSHRLSKACASLYPQRAQDHPVPPLSASGWLAFFIAASSLFLTEFMLKSIHRKVAHRNDPS